MKHLAIIGKVVVVAAILTAAVMSGAFSGVTDVYGFVFVMVGGASMALLGFRFPEMAAYNGSEG